MNSRRFRKFAFGSFLLHDLRRSKMQQPSGLETWCQAAAGHASKLWWSFMLMLNDTASTIEVDCCFSWWRTNSSPAAVLYYPRKKNLIGLDAVFCCCKRDIVICCILLMNIVICCSVSSWKEENDDVSVAHLYGDVRCHIFMCDDLLYCHSQSASCHGCNFEDRCTELDAFNILTWEIRYDSNKDRIYCTSWSSVLAMVPS